MSCKMSKQQNNCARKKNPTNNERDKFHHQCTESNHYRFHRNRADCWTEITINGNSFNLEIFILTNADIDLIERADFSFVLYSYTVYIIWHSTSIFLDKCIHSQITDFIAFGISHYYNWNVRGDNFTFFFVRTLKRNRISHQIIMEAMHGIPLKLYNEN